MNFRKIEAPESRLSELGSPKTIVFYPALGYEVEERSMGKRLKEVD
jgi:hypothetical protein